MSELHFPVYLRLGTLSLHPHFVFEALAYFFGFQTFLWLRRRGDDWMAVSQRLSIVAAAILGAALGSKLLFWLTDPARTLQNWSDPHALLGGKTIVGGLVGGLFLVEWVKKRMGITRSTGDPFAISMTVGIIIGRIGCFLTGLDDHTYGNPTQLPFGIDFGDGVRRHPTQLYEMLWTGCMLFFLLRMKRMPHREVDLFKLFLVGYLGFRFLIDFLKPGIFFLGLTAIQWVCLVTLLFYRRDLSILLGGRRGMSHG